MLAGRSVLATPDRYPYVCPALQSGLDVQRRRRQKAHAELAALKQNSLRTYRGDSFWL